MKEILKCKECGMHTMHEMCKCGGKAVTIAPPKYSPEDKYGSYRRKVKRKEWEEKGLIIQA